MSGLMERGKILANELRERILNGTYTVQLPSVNTLASEFGVNNRAVMSALASLESDGYVESRPRCGTFVSRAQRQRTWTLGVVLPDSSAPLGQKLVAGVQSAAMARGYGAVVKPYHGMQDRVLELVKSMVENHQVDGLVLWLDGSPMVEEYLKQEKIPFVMAMRDPAHDRNCHSVGTSNANAVAYVMMHLIGLGHRQIRFVSDRSFEGRSWLERRHAQYLRSLEAVGVEPLPRLLLDGTAAPEPHVRDALRQCSAVFCANDHVAARALVHCLREGIRVPDELAMAGYDNTLLASELEITSVEPHSKLIGEKAVELLLGALDGKLKSFVHAEIEAELVIRGSTDREAR